MRRMLNMALSRAFNGWLEMTLAKKEAMAMCTQVGGGCCFPSQELDAAQTQASRSVLALHTLSSADHPLWLQNQDPSQTRIPSTTQA